MHTILQACADIVGLDNRGAKRGGAQEHCSQKEMDRIDHGRRIWDKSLHLL